MGVSSIKNSLWNYGHIELQEGRKCKYVSEGYETINVRHQKQQRMKKKWEDELQSYVLLVLISLILQIQHSFTFVFMY